MYKEIILQPSSQRYQQFIDFFDTELSHLMTKIAPTAANFTTYRTVARGQRRFFINKLTEGNIRFGMYKLTNNSNAGAAISIYKEDLPFIFKIYKSEGSGILTAINEGAIRFSIFWYKVGQDTFFVFNGTEFSGFLDAATINSCLTLPINQIFPSVVQGFESNKDMILPCFALNQNENKLLDTPVSSVFHFTNFKNLAVNSEIKINGENYLVISSSKLLKY